MPARSRDWPKTDLPSSAAGHWLPFPDRRGCTYFRYYRCWWPLGETDGFSTSRIGYRTWRSPHLPGLDCQPACWMICSTLAMRSLSTLFKASSLSAWDADAVLTSHVIGIVLFDRAVTSEDF